MELAVLAWRGRSDAVATRGLTPGWLNTEEGFSGGCVRFGAWNYVPHIHLY